MLHLSMCAHLATKAASSFRVPTVCVVPERYCGAVRESTRYQEVPTDSSPFLDARGPRLGLDDGLAPVPHLHVDVHLRVRLRELLHALHEELPERSSGTHVVDARRAGRKPRATGKDTHLIPRELPPQSQYRNTISLHCHTPYRAMAGASRWRAALPGAASQSRPPPPLTRERRSAGLRRCAGTTSLFRWPRQSPRKAAPSSTTGIFLSEN